MKKKYDKEEKDTGGDKEKQAFISSIKLECQQIMDLRGWAQTWWASLENTHLWLVGFDSRTGAPTGEIVRYEDRDCLRRLTEHMERAVKFGWIEARENARDRFWKQNLMEAAK